MRAGNPFPLVYTYALDGLGYGAPLFYCDLFLYPFAALNAMGLSIYSTFKLLQVALLLANFLSIYRTAKAIFGDRVQAQVTAIAYTFSFYALLDIYYRAAIGECFAFIFLPVVYLGYYRVVHGREDQWWLMALGMTAIALSHTLSIILGVIFLLVMMLFDAKFWIRNFAKIRYLAYAALLCVGLACFFWLPMLEQLAQLPFRLNLDVGNEQNRFTNQMFSPLAPAGLAADRGRPQAGRSAAPAAPDEPVRQRGAGDRAVLRVAPRQGKPPAGADVRGDVRVRLAVWPLFDHPAAGGDAAGGVAIPRGASCSTPALAMALFLGASWPSIRPGFWRGAAAGALALCAAASIWVNFPANQYSDMVERAAEYDLSFEEFQRPSDDLQRGQRRPIPARRPRVRAHQRAARLPYAGI